MPLRFVIRAPQILSSRAALSRTKHKVGAPSFEYFAKVGYHGCGQSNDVIVSAVSYPPLSASSGQAPAKGAGAGHPQFRNGKKKLEKEGISVRLSLVDSISTGFGAKVLVFLDVGIAFS